MTLLQLRPPVVALMQLRPVQLLQLRPVELLLLRLVELPPPIAALVKLLQLLQLLLQIARSQRY